MNPSAEKIAFHTLPYVSYRSRLIACLIDMSLLDAFSIAMVIGIYFLCNHFKYAPQNLIFAICYVIVRFLSSLCYHTWGVPFSISGQKARGTTFGKRAFHILILNEKTQQPLTKRQAFLRFCMYGIESAFFIVAFLVNSFMKNYTSSEIAMTSLGFLISTGITLFVALFPVFNAKKKALHDLFASTSCRTYTP